MSTKELAIKPLYQIAIDYQVALQELDEIEDTASPEYQAALLKIEQQQLSAQDKAIAVAAYMRNLDAQQEAITNAIRAMQDRKKRLERIVEAREAYLLENMERCHINKINCPYFDISLRESKAVDVEDESLVTSDYIVTTVTKRVDKAKARSEMMAGVVIPGLRLAKRMNVQIK